MAAACFVLFRALNSSSCLLLFISSLSSSTIIVIITRIRHLLKNLHSEALNPLRSLSCSRLSKLLDLKADSSGGPNRLSVADTVELNLEGKTKFSRGGADGDSHDRWKEKELREGQKICPFRQKCDKQ